MGTCEKRRDTVAKANTNNRHDGVIVNISRAGAATLQSWASPATAATPHVSDGGIENPKCTSGSSRALTARTCLFPLEVTSVMQSCPFSCCCAQAKVVLKKAVAATDAGLR